MYAPNQASTMYQRLIFMRALPDHRADTPLFKIRRKDHGEIVSRILDIKNPHTRRALISTTVDEIFETLFNRLSSILQSDGSPAPWPQPTSSTDDDEQEEQDLEHEAKAKAKSKLKPKSFLPLDGTNDIVHEELMACSSVIAVI